MTTDATLIVNNRGNAGFGSNFTQIIDWYWYTRNTGIPVYVKWMWNGENFFNNFFIQKNSEKNPFFQTDTYYSTSALSNPVVDEIRYNEIPMYKKYNRAFTGQSGVYNEPEFKNLMIFFHELFNENLILRPIIQVPPLDNTLGVHIRVIGLYYVNSVYDFTKPEIPLYTVMSEQEFYNRNLNQIKEKFENGKYDNIYLACDDEKFLNICIKELKDKLVYQDYTRNLYHNSVNRYTQGNINEGLSQRPPLPIECYHVIVDMLYLLKCKDILGCVSGFTFPMLTLNPYVNFELFDTVKNVHTG